MEQYISKSALVAEIEKLKAYLQIPNAQLEAIKVCDNVISVIDTLEVKKVDLEKEVNNWRHNHFHGKRDKDASGEYLERVSQLDLAKHFFELGLKAKGEKKPQRIVSAEAKEAMYGKPAWSEEDERMTNELLSMACAYGSNEMIDWLKSLKDRVQP